jgi:hypothetical protein
MAGVSSGSVILKHCHVDAVDLRGLMTSPGITCNPANISKP